MTNSDFSQTLEQRLAAGRMPSGESLRISALLAEQLRLLHDQGRVHGALCPSAIVVGTSVQLCAPEATGITPYTAPELLQGYPPDARTDVFSFGAILYEILTGCRAFDGETAEELADALTAGAPAPSGDATVDRLVGGCLAKSPEGRYQQIQKIQLELKLMMAGARRAPVPAASPAAYRTLAPVPPVFAAMPAAAPAPVFAFAPPAPPATSPAAPAPMFAFAPPTPPAVSDPMVPIQMQELESRMAHRMERQERAVASVERVANEVLKALRGQPLASGNRSYSRGISDLDGDAAVRVEKTLDALYDKLARIDLVLGNAVERIQKLEENLDAFDIDAAALRDSVTRDIRNFEKVAKQQSSAIESARTAMGQTDDLVERVVEALDTLQSMFVTSSDNRSAAAS